MRTMIRILAGAALLSQQVGVRGDIRYVRGTHDTEEQVNLLGTDDDPTITRALTYISRSQNLESEFNNLPFTKKAGDEGVLYGTREIEGAPVVSPVQLYLDLSRTKGRGEEVD